MPQKVSEQRTDWSRILFKNASKTFVGDHWEKYWEFVGMGWDSKCALGIGPEIGGGGVKLGVGIGITRTGIGLRLHWSFATLSKQRSGC